MKGQSGTDSQPSLDFFLGAFQTTHSGMKWKKVMFFPQGAKNPSTWWCDVDANSSSWFKITCQLAK